MARVEIDNLNFSVGKAHILRDVNLVVEEGECLALLGPSGCGKTTTLRSIAGFIRPTAGDIRLGGQSVLGLPPHKRNVGLVFQDYALFPHMTVAENVAYGLRMRGVPARDQAARVMEALDLVQLTDLRDRMPSELSGGQQQRVSLARSLVIQPYVLLLDEPLGALDRQLRDYMQVELRRIQREAGITTIIVTHDQEEALSLSDQVAVMFDGRIVEVGRPAELYRAPGSHAVMEFLGASNIMDAVVEASEGAVCRLRTRSGLKLVASGAEPARKEVRIGIRPERIGVSHEPGETTDNVLAVTVQEAVYKGPHAELFVRTEEGDLLTVRWREAPDSTLQGPVIGARIFIEIPPSNILIFE